MRRIFLLATVCLLASCSSTRQQGFFHPKFENTGITVTPSNPEVIARSVPQDLTASASTSPVVVAPDKTVTAAQTEAVRRTYLQLNKEERKEVRKLIRAEIKKYAKAQKAKMAPDKVTAMDHDIKLAAIFGAVGIVAFLIGGDVFWIIGAVAMIIGVVFFVKWLVRQ